MSKKIVNTKNKFVVIAAIIALAAIELYAMSQGINGQLQAGIIIIIAGLGGWFIKRPKALQ